MSLARLHWSLYFLVITVGITALGTLLGEFTFILFGLMTGARFTILDLAYTGEATIGFYFMLWAPGIAIVLCVKRAYEQRRARDSKREGRTAGPSGWRCEDL